MKMIKKAQAGDKMVPSEMKPGKMIKKADRDARATKMADALDKQAGKGSSDRPMGLKFDKKSFDKTPSFDEYIKKTENKKVAPKKKMQYGGEAASMVPSNTMMKKGGSVEAKDGKWIQKAIKKPGALRSSLGVKKGEKIPAGKLAAAAKKPGKMGQRARLAQTLKKMKK